MPDIHFRRLIAPLGALMLGALAPRAEAQAAAPTATLADSADSVPHKKHGGLFSKAKHLASSKVVKSVAKVAACTMVPGGQAIASAIDASDAKNAGQVAQGAAGAATGSACMPGMGGAGMASAAANAASASARSGPPQGMMPYGAGGGWAGATTPTMAQMAAESEPEERALAECYGISYEDFVAMIRPTGFDNRAPTKAELKRASQISKKVGAQKQADCQRTVGMQQGAMQMAAAEQAMAGAQSRMAQAQTQAAAGTVTELPGQLPVIADDPSADLAKGKGKTAVRQIDWVAGSSEVSAAARPAFEEALGKLGQAMRQAGGRYRVDLFMNQRYDEAAAQRYGPGRLAAVQQVLGRGSELALEPGKIKRDKDARVEIVRLK